MEEKRGVKAVHGRKRGVRGRGKEKKCVETGSRTVP